MSDSPGIQPSLSRHRGSFVLSDDSFEDCFESSASESRRGSGNETLSLSVVEISMAKLIEMEDRIYALEIRNSDLESEARLIPREIELRPAEREAQCRIYVWEWLASREADRLSPHDITKGTLADIVKEVNVDRGLVTFSIFYGDSSARILMRYASPRRWLQIVTTLQKVYKIYVSVFMPVDKCTYNVVFKNLIRTVDPRPFISISCLMSISVNYPIGPFTLPPELLTLSVDDKHIFTRYNDGSVDRRIFCNIALSEQELDEIEELNDYLSSLGVLLRRRMETKKLRYLISTGGNVKKAAAMMMETERWRESFFEEPIDDREIYSDLNLGFVYISGRDKYLRPCLVVRVAEMLRNDVDQAASLRCVCFLMEFITRYMLLPGKCESTITLLDLENIGLMQFVPAVARTRAIFGDASGHGFRDCSISRATYVTLFCYQKILAEHYVGRSALTFVKSAPTALERLISGLVPEEKRRKIVYVKDNRDIAKCLGLPTVRGELWERGVPHRPLRFAAESVKYFRALGLPQPERVMFRDEVTPTQREVRSTSPGGVCKILMGVANLPSPVPEGTMEDMMEDDYDLVMTHAYSESQDGWQTFQKPHCPRTASTGSEETPVAQYSSLATTFLPQRLGSFKKLGRSKPGPRMTPERPSRAFTRGHIDALACTLRMRANYWVTVYRIHVVLPFKPRVRLAEPPRTASISDPSGAGVPPIGDLDDDPWTDKYFIYQSMSRNILSKVRLVCRAPYSRGIAHAVERLAMLEKGLSEAADGVALIKTSRDLIRLLKRDADKLPDGGILSPQGALALINKAAAERLDDLAPSQCCELLFYLTEARQWALCDKDIISRLVKKGVGGESVAVKDVTIAIHAATALELESDKKIKLAVSKALAALDFNAPSFLDVARLAVVLGACTTRAFASEQLVQKLSEALLSSCPERALSIGELDIVSNALVSLCRSLPRDVAVNGRGELLEKLLAHNGEWSSNATCDVLYSAHVLGTPLHDSLAVETMLDSFDPAKVQCADRLCRLLASVPSAELPFVAQCTLPHLHISELSRSNALKVASGLLMHSSSFDEAIKDTCDRLVELANTMNHRHAWECMAICKQFHHDALLEASCRVLLAGKQRFTAANRTLLGEVLGEVKRRDRRVPAVLEDLKERINDDDGGNMKADVALSSKGRQSNKHTDEDDLPGDDSLFLDSELKCLRKAAKRTKLMGGSGPAEENENLYESFCRSKLLTMLEKMEAGHDPVAEVNAMIKQQRDNRREKLRNADEGPQVTGRLKKKRKPRNEREKRRLALFKMGNYQPFIFAKQQLEVLRAREMDIAKECWALRNPQVRKRRKAAEVRKNEEEHLKRMFTVS
ncbi:hypothetical protein FOL47_002237 [Perkinsus chesapeaki]|uniref:CRAL-TRIO domain-containing protein n=1 Tax=Perkinsus chesapeaki TaxID=330153 RepID=A0A7J6N097_PERCH|nr:hypothetical protein FOL47_002237 [Perkinsus chesapeaki]